MTTAILINLCLALAIVTTIVALLAWAIRTQHRDAPALAARARRPHRPTWAPHGHPVAAESRRGPRTNENLGGLFSQRRTT